MSIATYPYAASPADPAKVIPLLPLLPPPVTERSPAARLPSRPDRQPLPGYTLTRHTFPGAYPRTAPGFVSYDNKFNETDDPLGNVYSSDKKERLKLIDEAVGKVRQVYLEAGARTAQDAEKSEIDEPVVRLAVNRFVRKDLSTSSSDDRGITLVVCHANGFHKEMWEETIHAFLAYNNSRPGSSQIKVDEIWALDFANQGESFRLNGGRIGPIASWADCARDILSLVQHCLPDVGAPIPEALEYSTEITTKKRRFIGVGHSIGGNTITQAAHAVPGLFESLFLVDPMTRAIDMVIDAQYGPTLARISARQDLLRSPYFQAWHPAIFDVFLSHGLVNVDPSPSIDTEDLNVPVTLACPRWAEAAVFTDWKGIQAGYDKLPFLDKNLKVRFVMAGDPSATGGEERTRLIVWRPPTSENIILTEASHLVTQEKPDILGEQLWRSLANLPLGPPNKEKQAKAKL
ncbi:hypothetical protein QFC24_001339 [Naganishia onofrii]|uniref:Uncharacterized protein n=1 Tax=Naganishia onofrii TaxID=1851511 RepID=A0ACC2XSU0_9TREE|nr:hypothetical protein QFC24_001339 [Naganishia onofrii]